MDAWIEHVSLGICFVFILWCGVGLKDAKDKSANACVFPLLNIDGKGETFEMGYAVLNLHFVWQANLITMISMGVTWKMVDMQLGIS